jgi:hypothetical protein
MQNLIKTINMKKKLSYTLFLVCCLIASQSITAQKNSRPNTGKVGTWHLIGSTKVTGGGVDYDIIRVTGPGDNFRKLKFKVTKSGLNMIRMVVTYDNGSSEKINIRQNIPEGGKSRVIDLRGGKRSIRNIQFWYEDKGFLNGRAKVTIYGRK